MSADWFFMKKGFLGTKKIGPIAESDFLHRIERGEISPETMVSSTSKTHGHWLHLREIRAGVKFWNKTHPNATVASEPPNHSHSDAPPRSE